MSRSAVVCSVLCAVALGASAGDRTARLGTPQSGSIPALDVRVRTLDETTRVLSDDRGGWRLERYVSNHRFLVEVEDSYGLLVQVVRDLDGRPVGVQLAGRYALEYFYSRPGGPCQRRILYEPRTGRVIAQVVDIQPQATELEPASLAARPAPERSGVATVRVGGRDYAFLSDAGHGSVIRSIEIDDPESGSVLDRIDYTESHLIVRLGWDVEHRPRIFTIPRYIEQSSQPTVVEIDVRRGAGSDAVWSFAGRGRSPAIPAPILRGALPSAVADTLRAAFPRALRRVRELPACRSLFEDLATSGNRRLTSTLYVPPGDQATDDSCDRGALAFTHVGSSLTHLCESFAGLTLDQATIVLIHEALHFGGMEEAPFYDGALTSGEINRLVAENCGF